MLLLGAACRTLFDGEEGRVVTVPLVGDSVALLVTPLDPVVVRVSVFALL